MSPEKARGDVADARTDLFSFGALLYALCTGRRPFQGPSFSAILMSLASDTPPLPHSINPEVPEPLAELVMQMLSRNPKRRPASAQEVLDRLEEIGNDLDG